jgi:hypothetical protein
VNSRIISDGNTIGIYIASDLSTITKDASDRVAGWNDKLAGGHPLLQAGADNIKPVWSADGISTDGIRQYMKTGIFTFARPAYVYLVFKHNNWVANGCFTDGDTGGTMMLYQATATPGLACWGGPGSATKTDLEVNTFGIVRILFQPLANQNLSSFQINAGSKWVGNMGVIAPDGITIGAGSALTGTYGCGTYKEIIVRKAADSDANSDIIYNYLKKKYSL